MGSSENQAILLEQEAQIGQGVQVPRKKRKHVFLRVVGILLGIGVLACLGVCVAAAVIPTVFNRVDVMGVDVSGLTKTEIKELWQEKGKEICADTTVSLVMDGETVRQIALDELAVTIQPIDAARCAWDVCHGDSFWENGWHLVESLYVDKSLMPPLSLDEKALDEAVAKVDEELSIAPVDTAYRVDRDDTESIYLTRAKDGRKLDEAGLRLGIQRLVRGGRLAPVECRCDVVKAQETSIEEIHEAIYQEMYNAGLDKSSGEIYEGQVGVDFDVEKVQGLMDQAKPGQEFVAPLTVTRPRVTRDQLKEVLFRDTLGTYSTYVSGTANRQGNVALAARYVSGSILNSGEVFSYNDTVGETSEANGFLPAPAYVNGKTVDNPGGGVCQVSSTMYYATLLSNLEIVERYCHQYAPSYIPFGCDATTYYPWPDYCFRNNTDYPIQISAGMSGGYLTVTIYGTKLDDSYVEMVSETLASDPYEVIYQDDDSLPAGTTKVDQDGYTGYTVQTWRNVYSGDGTLLSSTVESYDEYERRDEIILRGTGGAVAVQEKPQETSEEAPPAEE